MRISESMPERSGKRINGPLSDFNLFVLFQCLVCALYPLRPHEWWKASLEGRGSFAYPHGILSIFGLNIVNLNCQS